MIDAPLVIQIEADLIRDEGKIPYAYQDSRGYWTIGVGHLIDKRLGGSLPQDIVQTLLERDIQHTISLCSQHPWYQTLDTDNRRRAIINMVFNLGLGHFMSLDTFISLLQEKKWKEAADDLRHTLYYNQTGQRAERIAQLIENG